MAAMIHVNHSILGFAIGKSPYMGVVFIFSLFFTSLTILRIHHEITKGFVYGDGLCCHPRNKWR